ncbi:NgoMIV family type II restriction endonuclease [Rothia sp. AR01]|uniref:NgoMIV family type II restriction endonuclease n=1 Tax=Rothia santali TaxID=2949643 RepID=A0A9X2HGF7_9MICC|nr:NgoMIV family type II restriction endonuclease [Rothia santali]MCP3426272.1 NgoMIV family type II restriction endonuclease [Rothia santali]
MQPRPSAPREPDLHEAMTRAERAVFHRASPEFLLDRARRVFHRALLDERVLVTHPSTGVPSNADKDSGTSVRYATAIAEGIGAVEAAPRAPGQSASRNFERAVAAYLQGIFPAFGAVRPGEWMVRRLGDRNEYGGIEDASEIFEQYEHLVSLRETIESDRALRGLLGYEAEILAPDVVVARAPIPDAELNELTRLVDPLGPLAAASPLRAAVQPKLLLHAVVACKWTLRSDRAQQARAEAQHLVRNRRGRAPHLVMVTGEPMPSRIAAVALGTGDLDCVYHFALHELMDAIDPQADPAGAELLHTMVQGRRLRDISDLPLDLAV